MSPVNGRDSGGGGGGDFASTRIIFYWQVLPVQVQIEQ